MLVADIYMAQVAISPQTSLSQTCALVPAITYAMALNMTMVVLAALASSGAALGGNHNPIAAATMPQPTVHYVKDLLERMEEKQAEKAEGGKGEKGEVNEGEEMGPWCAAEEKAVEELKVVEETEAVEEGPDAREDT